MQQIVAKSLAHWFRRLKCISVSQGHVCYQWCLQFSRDDIKLLQRSDSEDYIFCRVGISIGYPGDLFDGAQAHNLSLVRELK